MGVPLPRVFVITSGQIKISNRIALILHAADQDLVLLPPLWLILPVVFFYWDFNIITKPACFRRSLRVRRDVTLFFLLTSPCAVIKTCYTMTDDYPPPPPPLPPPKILGCKTQPEITTRAIKWTFIEKKNAAPYERKKKGICSFSVVNHKWSLKVNKRQRADREPYFTAAESAGGLNLVA